MANVSSLSLSARSIADVLSSDDIVAEFFREELATLSHPRDSDALSISTTGTARSRSSAFYSLTRRFSRVSLDSVDLQTVQKFALHELCQFIADHPSLQSAGVISCSCFTVPSAVFFIPHRFILLQLRRNGRRDVWLRLDRLRSPDVSLVELALTLGTTPSNDRAALASSRAELITPNAIEESELAFEIPCFLSNLRGRLLDMIDVMKEYKLTSENCWAFCSLLLSFFTEQSCAEFRSGRLRHPSLAREVETQLSEIERVRRCERLAPLAPILSPHDPSKFLPFSVLLRDLGMSARLRMAARIWEDLDMTNSPYNSPSTRELIRSLSDWNSKVYAQPSSQLALQTSALCDQIVISAGSSWARVDHVISNGCVDLLCWHGKAYQDRYQDQYRPKPKAALPLFERASSLCVPGITENKNVFNLHYYHAMALEDLDRVDEAKAAVHKFVESVRHYGWLTLWYGPIGHLSRQGLLPAEFEYLLELQEGDLPVWKYWREDQPEAISRNPRGSLRSPSSDDLPSSSSPLPIVSSTNPTSPPLTASPASSFSNPLTPSSAGVVSDLTDDEGSESKSGDVERDTGSEEEEEGADEASDVDDVRVRDYSVEVR